MGDPRVYKKGYSTNNLDTFFIFLAFHVSGLDYPFRIKSGNFAAFQLFTIVTSPEVYKPLTFPWFFPFLSSFCTQISTYDRR